MFVEFKIEELFPVLCVIAVFVVVYYAYEKYKKGKESLEIANARLEQVKRREAEVKKADEEILKAQDDLEYQQTLFATALQETKQSRPLLVQMYAEAKYQTDVYSAELLEKKDRPAPKAAEEVRRLSREKREIMQISKQLKYQLDFYESIFPWLEEFKEVPIDEAIEMSSDSETDEYESLRKWLSPDEYKKLKPAVKYQMALDRWKQRKKSSWEIGIDFERCVGYQLEKKGYAVKYLGATLGLEDMGRDLLATKNGVTLVIQCKRWAKEKTIHEKHICQLYGSVAVLATQNPGKKYKGVFITTTTLSDTAKMFAEYSGISYVENCETPDYPMIKCNVSKNGERIYHLPFDQQYDRAIISKKDGDFYAWTTKEAEKAGFRRAFRWHPESGT